MEGEDKQSYLEANMKSPSEGNTSSFKTFFNSLNALSDFPLKYFEPTEEGDLRIAEFYKIPVVERTFPQSLVSKSDKEVRSPSIVVESDSSETSEMSTSSRQTRSSIRSMSIAEQIKKTVKTEPGSLPVDSKTNVKKSVPAHPPKRQRVENEELFFLGEVSAGASEYLDTFLMKGAEAYHANTPLSKLNEEAALLSLKCMQASLVGAKRTQALEVEVVKLRSDKRALEEKCHRASEALEGLKKESSAALQKKDKEIQDLKADMQENGLYFGWKGRLEALEEYFKGEHTSWNLEESRRQFLERFPDELEFAGSDANAGDTVQDCAAGAIQGAQEIPGGEVPTPGVLAEKVPVEKASTSVEVAAQGGDKSRDDA